MATTGPSTLRERIAALQSRGTSPQPTPPTRSQTPTSPPKAGGTGLRDKIARFEQKGGTPIPRGSFGLGAPSQGGRRNNELWGNRIPSAGRSTSAGTASLGRSASLSMGSSGRARPVSMADVQLSGLQRLQEDLRAAAEQEPAIAVETTKDSDMIESLDIANHTPTSPTFKVASPVRQTFIPPKENIITTPGEPVELEPVMETVEMPIPSAVSPPPIIVIDEEVENEPDSDPAFSSPIEDSSEAVTPIDVPELNGFSVSKDLRNEETDKNILLPISDQPSSAPAIVTDEPQCAPLVEAEALKPSSPSMPEQASAHKLEDPGNPPIDSAPVPAPVGQLLAESERMPTAHKELPQVSPGSEYESSAPDESPLFPPPLKNAASLVDSIHPPTSPDMPAADESDRAAAYDNRSQAEKASSNLEEASLPTPPPKESLFLSTPRPGDSLVESSTTIDLTTPSGPKDTLWGHDDIADQSTLLPEHQSHSSESSTPLSTSSTVTLDSLAASKATPNPTELHRLAVSDSAPHSPTTSNRCDGVASSSVSEASCDSPPHVTPILDAFPAVPRYLPPTSLPSRAHTISGRTRTVTDRNSASSTSSTKSTPSLSFSSTGSSSSSPTSSVLTTPQAPPSSRRPAVGLQRSKSQRARPISSVPAWYDDDSDDGEAGWANVVVTTRRY